MAAKRNGSFAGKVAFVTGAASGIGRTAALAFAREGAGVVVADVSEQSNQETARIIEEQGGRTLAARCDVTQVEDVKAALAKTVEAFGRLDFAFNNAGIEPSKLSLTAMTPHLSAHGVKMPVLMVQVKDDEWTKNPEDAQRTFDLLGSKEKELLWIEGTKKRFRDGYNYFGRYPQKIIPFFDKYNIWTRREARFQKRER